MKEGYTKRLDYVASRYRLMGSKIVVAFVVLLLLISEHTWDPDGLIDTLFEILGLFFVLCCTMGRIWTSMYIAGYKNRELITVGPYSVMRNPLYFFNLLGAIGIGFSAESLTVLFILLMTFVVYYPLVVIHEERKLVGLHSHDYLEYMRRTPRFFPKWSLFHEPAEYVVDSRRYRRAFLDGFVFIFAYEALALIEKLHEVRILPSLFRII